LKASGRAAAAAALGAGSLCSNFFHRDRDATIKSRTAWTPSDECLRRYSLTPPPGDAFRMPVSERRDSSGTLLAPGSPFEPRAGDAPEVISPASSPIERRPPRIAAPGKRQGADRSP